MAIFDDEQPDAKAKVTVEDDRWDSLIRMLEGVPERGLEPPEAERLRDIDARDRPSALNELEKRFPAEVAEDRRLPEAIRDAGLWANWLTAAHVGVDVFESWADFEARAAGEGRSTAEKLAQYGVILLDYRFGEGGDGTVSRLIAQQIARDTRTLVAAGGNVPILVRFSAEAVEKTEADILEFLDGLKFPRSAYAVVPKSSIRAEGWEESFLRDLEKADTGRRLYALTVATQTVVMNAIESEADRLLFKLDAPSVRLLNEQALEPEGVAQVEHWTDIIISLLASSLRESEDVARATGAMLDLMAASAMPGAPSTVPALSRIENRLRFDYAVNRLRRPIDFGDLFAFDLAPDKVAVVVTQACDMAIRIGKGADGQASGVPERPRLVLLMGDLHQDGLPLGQSDDGWTTDFAMAGEDDPTYAIEWKFNSPVMLPRAGLDLVSLNVDGRALIGDAAPPDAGFWSTAFRLYIEALLSEVNAAPEGGPPADPPVRFPGDDRAGKAPGLGSFAEYPVGVGPNPKERTLGIRRIARLRTVETQRIAHQMNFWSGRVALATQLRTKRKDLKIRLKPLDGDALAPMSADGLYIKGNQLSRVEVATAEFRELCRLLPTFAPLDAAASVWGERFDLKGMLDADEMKDRFKLHSTGAEQFDIREKMLPGAEPVALKGRPPRTKE